MKSKTLALLAVLGFLSGTLLAGQASAAVQIITKEDIIQKTIPVSAIVKTADNAILLIDTSASMKKPYRGMGVSRLEAMKNALVTRMESFPELDIRMGIYVYTPWKPIYPIQPLDGQRIIEALKALPAQTSGETFLTRAFENLDPILAGLTGRTIVFLVSDGQYSLGRHMKKPEVRAKELAEKYDVCFYLISTADTKRQERNLEAIAAVNECSRIIPFTVWMERPEYNSGALYVVKCTQETISVSRQRIVGLKTDDILFPFDSSEIAPQYLEELDAIGKFVREHPQSFVIVHGYSDSSGHPEYNMRLSRRRAEAVANYLKTNYDIPDHRMVVMWYGELNPVADNATEEGRSRNRRVEIGIGGLGKGK